MNRQDNNVCDNDNDRRPIEQVNEWRLNPGEQSPVKGEKGTFKEP